MTYLELVRRLAQEVGASGYIQTVQSTEGEVARLAGWVNEAWRDIQMSRDSWRWRVAEFEVPVLSGANKPDFSVYNDFYRVIPEEVYIAPAGADAFTPMTFVDFTHWQGFVRSRPSAAGLPVYFTELPDYSVEVYPAAATDTSMRGLYTKQVQVLVDDVDTPIMPEQYHMAIVYKAMMLYAGYEAAPEVFQAGAQGFNRTYNQMVIEDTPPVLLPGGLA